MQLRGFAQRVEDLIARVQGASRAATWSSRTSTRSPTARTRTRRSWTASSRSSSSRGEQFYLGAAVSQLDRKQAIPAVSPQRERLLEYDLARAIARVASAERPVIGLMSALPVLGETFNPMTRQSSEPWVLASELKRDFDVKQVSLLAQIASTPTIKVLLLIHPRDMPEATEYALDQFVLRGGKLIAFVDPLAYFDQQPEPDARHGRRRHQLRRCRRCSRPGAWR